MIRGNCSRGGSSESSPTSMHSNLSWLSWTAILQFFKAQRLKRQCMAGSGLSLASVMERKPHMSSHSLPNSNKVSFQPGPKGILASAEMSGKLSLLLSTSSTELRAPKVF